jgi:hypothetical protein
MNMTDDLTRDEFEQSMLESVEKGLVEIVGERDGQPLFAVTQAGEEHVERLLDDMLDQAAAVFARNLGIPLYVARDLLLMRAAKLKELDS